MKKIHDLLSYVDGQDLYPDITEIGGPVCNEVTIESRPVVMFGSNNYLGLATHPNVIRAGIEALEKYGSGSDGSRLLSGNLSIHKELERKIATFKGGEDAVVWPSGYAANIGIITAFVNPFKLKMSDHFERPAIVISDELNHASIIDGIRMSRVKKAVYPHNDMHALEGLLKKFRHRRKLVVTDGVFSMDGDVAPLDTIVRLAKKYGASTMVDEAHATGVLGTTGHGTLEHFGLKAVRDVDIVMGTFSKALAGVGGFAVGSSELTRYLRIASRPYMFSTAMTPATAASLIEALVVIESEPQLRQQLVDNTNKLRDGLHALGFHTFGSTTQIIPILIGTDENATKMSRELRARGYYAPAVRWPAVPKSAARLRLTVMATHTESQIGGLLGACKEVLSELSLTPPTPKK